MTETTEIDTNARMNEVMVAVDRANGHRRARTLSHSDAYQCVNDILGCIATGTHWRADDAGSVANNYGYTADTTVILAVTIDGAVYVGVGVSPCPDPSPGRVWRSLRPFGRGVRFPDKLRDWTKEPGVIRVR